MSWIDSFLADTVGVGYRAVTGNVDPWTKTAIQDDAAAGVTQALGPNASPIAVQQAQDSARQLITTELTSADADPSQAGVRIPGLGVLGTPDFLANAQKYLYVALVVAAIIAGFYVFRLFKK